MKTLSMILLASLLAVSAGLAVDVPPTVVQTTAVSVAVSPVAMLSAPSAVAANLAVNSPDDIKYGRSVLTQCEGAGLAFSHNSTTPQNVVAQAVHDAGNGTNDMLISVSVGERNPAILVNGGADTGSQTVWSNIPAGGYNELLTWTFDGTLAGTPSGAYGWTVTFTAMAAQ